MNSSKYKLAFFIAIAICLALTGTLAYVLRGHLLNAPEQESVVAAKSPEATPVSSSSVTPAPTTSALAPVQLSPQRLQAIGVKTATVELQDVSNDLRVPGNVDVNERQLAYVQTRFPGWIQKVFANATYQYVRKGDPLFTIYSQEILSTEQEYLLARQNQQTFATDGH